MKLQQLFRVSAMSVAALLSTAALADPNVDFSSLGPTATFNSAANDSVTVDGVTADGFLYLGGTTYTQSDSQLWLRNNSDDHGLGVCSTGEDCGPVNSTGFGDNNELSNGVNDEVIRLSRNSSGAWTDVWVSSLDANVGTGGGLETGIVYWSNNAAPDLNSMTGITINMNNSLGGSDEGSIFGYLTANGMDASAQYLFFRASPASVDQAGALNNDYLVYGVSAVPEPESYAMLLAGLGLLGFGRRRLLRK